MKRACILVLVGLIGAPLGSALAGDKEDLTAMLHDFLAGASESSAEAHDRFWAEELVYSSSAGLRFGKADIMEGLSEPPDPDAPSTVYTAEEVDVRLYDDAAVVAFRLVGTPEEGDVLHYFNTGTFLKRDGEWRVVAWQATRIPEDAED